MSDPTPLDPARPTSEQLEREIRVCDRFEADWREGRRPQIEALLIEVPEPARPSLLHKLIGLEVELRADHGERPTREEYGARFPEHGGLIDTLFVGMSTPGGTSGDGSDAIRGDTAGASSFTELRFRILRPHAEGGLGVVYVALDGELNREVALKEIRTKFAHDLEYRSRFLAEAEITGRLEHPGIVPVYSLGRYPDGRPFYAMRFIRGEDLKLAIDRLHRAIARRDRGNGASFFRRTLLGKWGELATRKHPDRGRARRLAEEKARRRLLRRLMDVCHVIEFAHSRGILHRDIKPSNVMLGDHGETLVVDWGLAKSMDRPDEPGSIRGASAGAASAGPAPTLIGSEMGTPAFMSPEQANGQSDRLGPPSDIYCLGATLYYLLTGQAPHQGRDRGEILEMARMGAFPEPRQVCKDIARPLEAICRKAMAREPEDRYESAELMALDIESWLDGEPVAAYQAHFPLSFWHDVRHNVLSYPEARRNVQKASRIGAKLGIVIFWIFAIVSSPLAVPVLLAGGIGNLTGRIVGRIWGDPKRLSEWGWRLGVRGGATLWCVFLLLWIVAPMKSRKAAPSPPSPPTAAKPRSTPIHVRELASRHAALASALLECPDHRLRDLPSALQLARRAVHLAPREGEYWTTLGLVEYRSGDDQAATSAIERSMQLRSGGDGTDWFVLAMAHARRGDRAKSLHWYRKASLWMEGTRNQDAGLRSLRDEAAALLGRLPVER